MHFLPTCSSQLRIKVNLRSVRISALMKSRFCLLTDHLLFEYLLCKLNKTASSVQRRVFPCACLIQGSQILHTAIFFADRICVIVLRQSCRCSLDCLQICNLPFWPSWNLGQWVLPTFASLCYASGELASKLHQWMPFSSLDQWIFGGWGGLNEYVSHRHMYLNGWS